MFCSRAAPLWLLQAGLSRAETVATPSERYEIDGCSCSMHTLARSLRPRPARVSAIALSRSSLRVDGATWRRWPHPVRELRELFCEVLLSS